MDELILQEHNVPGRGEIDLLKDICAIVDSARSSVAKHANSEITLMNWYIGERINREILGNTRAEYGKQIVLRLATQLKGCTVFYRASVEGCIKKIHCSAKKHSCKAIGRQRG